MLDSVALTPEHCQVLTTTTTTTSAQLQIRLAFCPVLDRTSTAFIAWLRSATGPVSMVHCHMDAGVLAEALSPGCAGNSSSKSNTRLTELVHSVPYSSVGFSLVVRALALNHSLQSLTLHQEMSDKNWTLLCESVIQPNYSNSKTDTNAAQSLHTLDCRGNGQRVLRGKTAGMSEERITRRMRVLAVAMRDNTVLQHLHLSDQVVDNTIYPAQIFPRVQANLYRSRFLKVQQQADDSDSDTLGGNSKQMRAKVLLAALQSVRIDPNLLWMLLSENRDVAFAACCSSPRQEAVETVGGNNDSDTTMMLTTTGNSYDAALDTSKRKREYD
jgi:hypothetical protein